MSVNNKELGKKCWQINPNYWDGVLFSFFNVECI